MTYADWILDGAVATTLPFLAWRAVRAPALNQAIVLFVAFGLMSALAWTRLGAVDVALVEASIGAGLSGALFMSALSWARSGPCAPRRPPCRWHSFVTLGLAACLASIVLGLPESEGLTGDVSAHLNDAGVSQPVTAVLMNYRGYDTLLETIVLLVATIAVRLIQGGPSRSDGGEPSDLLRALMNLLLPVSVLLSGYLVWRGSFAPGGAFQAGAVLAGGGVVLMLANRMRGPQMSSRVVRTCLLAGPAFFLVLSGSPLLVADGHLLEYPRASAGAFIFALESALAISIALVLLMFFPGSSNPDAATASQPPRDDS